MRNRKLRIVSLVALASGTLFVSTCDAVLQTINLAFGIVDTWI